MTEEDFERESRLMAIEFMLAHIYNVACKLAGATEDVITEVEREALQGLVTNAVAEAGKLTPVQKDHLSSETTLAIERLFDIARQRRT